MLINVTDKAITRFTEQLEQRGKGIGVIVGVKQTGCSGYAYTLEFVDTSTDCFQKHFDKFTLFVEPEAEKYLDGITIDFVKKGLSEMFEFINPNEKARCGCGESFTV